MTHHQYGLSDPGACRPAGAGECRRCLLAASFDSAPQLLVHDAELRRLYPKPLVLRAFALLLGAAADDLLTPVPDDDPTVQLASQNLPDGSGRPAATITTRGRDPLPIQGLSDLHQAEAICVELKDAANDLGLRSVDLAYNVGALAFRCRDLDIVVAEHLAAGHM